MERASAAGLYDLLHKEAPFHDGEWKNWSAERSDAFPFHYLDGVSIIVTAEDVNPGDHFTTKRNANPLTGSDQGSSSGTASVDPSADDAQEHDE